NHSYLGRHRFPGDPYKFSESPWRVERGAPLLGEHQQEIAGEFTHPSQWLAKVVGRPLSRATSVLPFDGVRVVSFPTGIVGPALGSLLAEHGAEVISVEAAAPCAARSAASDFKSLLISKAIAARSEWPSI